MNAKSLRFVFVFALLAVVFAASSLAAAQAPAAPNPLDGKVFVSPQGSAYNARWDGWVLTQPDLPAPELRKAHQVTVTIPEGDYVFDGVSCRLIKLDSGRVEVAYKENGREFVASSQGDYLIQCLQGAASGFQIVEANAAVLAATEVANTSTNPMCGLRFASDEGDAYSAVWGGSSCWWLHQDKLPGTRSAHQVDISLMPDMAYRFNGKLCQLLDTTDQVIVQYGNQIEFSVPASNDIQPYKVACKAGGESGWSIETINEPEFKPDVTPDATHWNALAKLLASNAADPGIALTPVPATPTSAATAAATATH